MTLDDYLRERYRTSTARVYANQIARYRRERESVEAADYGAVLGYLAERRRAGASAKTLHRELDALKVYYEYLLAAGVRDDHPCRSLSLADAQDRSVRLDELYEREQLDGLLKDYRAADRRNQRRGEVVVGLLIYQALTAGEVTRLRLEDVDLEAGTVYVGAGGKTAARTLGLRASQVLTLWRYVEEDRGRYVAMAEERVNSVGGGRTDWLLFDTRGGQLQGGEINRLINRGRAKRDKLRPQKIRQTVIAELLAAGHDVRIVQAFAGHRRSSATEQYERTGLEELAEAVAKHHPRQG